MKTLPVDADRQSIIGLLEEWTELLAQEKYAEALDLLPPDPDQNWTPELLESDVYGYGLPGCTREEIERDFGSADYKVTSLRDCPDREKILRMLDVSYFTPKGRPDELGMVHYECVPLNGEMSDLTGIFYLKKVSDTAMVLEFHDLHVM